MIRAKYAPAALGRDLPARCNYSNYTIPTELKIARIGNSKGIRLPAATLRRYGSGASVVMEKRIDGIMLRPSGPPVARLSWEDTAREIALDAPNLTAHLAPGGMRVDRYRRATGFIRVLFRHIVRQPAAPKR